MKVIELEIVCLLGIYHLALGVRSKMNNMEALASWEQLLQCIDTEGASYWLHREGFITKHKEAI